MSFIFFKKKIFSNHIIIFLLFVIFSILLSILIPGRLHRHYLHSFLPIIVIFTGTLGGIYFLELKEKLKKTFIYFFIFIYFCGTLLLSISLLSESKSIYAVKGYDKNINFKSVNLKSPNIFKYLNLNTQSNLFVWGWMPHLYILSHLTPATQETITEKQIIYSANQNYYLKRVIKDLNFSKPDLIIDTVNGKSFRFDINSIEKNIMNFADLKNYIQNNYKLIKGYKNNPECAKNYISNNKYNLLKKNLIRFSSIESKKVKLSYNKSYDILDFRAANLDDFSVTEDTCFDYWLLPDGEVGQVSLLFQKEELVKKVLILNTKNSNITDRSTNEIEIKLLQKKKLKKKNKIKLQSYPYWTEIILDKPIKADEITVEILSFYGNGAGLNEIKVFRAF